MWPEWLEKHFVPLLKRYLNEELDCDVRIFYDKQIEKKNVTWPIALAKALSQSAILVPLFSKSYFRSDWCVSEFSHMYKREIDTGFRTIENECGLIVPAIVHDGEENIPDEARIIQSVKIQDYALANLQPRTKDALELEKIIRAWAPEIARCINSAPQYSNSWEKPLSEEFIKKFGILHMTPEVPYSVFNQDFARNYCITADSCVSRVAIPK
ncbi:MAG: TIR domain-containing protein, partial [Desulfobacteraceae bacterium]|nr:TIR domain-containing protein [Desulfobacteraceae bacterium]